MKMTSRDYDMSDDSALESDISSLLSDDIDEERQAVDDLLSAEQLSDSYQNPAMLPGMQLSISSRCRVRRATTARDVAPPASVMTTRRLRKPSAKIVAASASGTNRKTTMVGEVPKTKASKKLPPLSSLVNSGPSTVATSSSSAVSAATVTSGSKKDRLLMRQWLILMADTNRIPNMYWYNEEHTQIRIPWKHGSRSCWTLDDCMLYKEWAKHTGKYAESQADEPKRWKANFRCALNSLPDVREVKNAGQTRGNSPFKVYELSEEVNRKNTLRRMRKSRRPKVDHCEKPLLPLAVISSSAVGSSQTTPKKSGTSPAVRQVSALRKAPVALVSPTQRSPNPVHRQFEVTKPAISTYRSVSTSSSGVIPVMVEEMSLDEGRDASDGPLCGGRSDLVVEFNSDYERSPSESSGYETDPNLYNDVPVITEVDWNAGLPEDDIYMPDIQEDQLQNLETVDIVSWLYS